MIVSDFLTEVSAIVIPRRIVFGKTMQYLNLRTRFRVTSTLGCGRTACDDGLITTTKLIDMESKENADDKSGDVDRTL